MRILRKQNIEDFLFFDIETAPSVPVLEKDTPLWDAWEYHCIKNGIEDVAGSYFKEAPLHGEFGRIACITIGAVRNGEIIIKSFKDGDEKELLENFNSSVSKFATNKTWLCGHVITGFDIPFVAKRCYVNGILPHILFDVAHLKPWELSVMDTATLWKGTAFKMSTLISVCAALGVDSPKDDIDGGDVGKLFWEGGIDRITDYCEKDVVAVVNVVRKLRGEEALERAVVEVIKPVGLIEHIFGGGEVTEDMLDELRKVMAREILNSLPCRAKGKKTDITKAQIKTLF